MRYTCCSNLRQGNLRQLSLSEAGGVFRSLLGAFVSGILLVPLSSMSSCLRQHIQRLSRWRWLLRQSCSKAAYGLDTYSLHRPSMRANLRVISFRWCVFRYVRSALSTRCRLWVKRNIHRVFLLHHYLLVKLLSPFSLLSFVMVLSRIRCTHLVRWASNRSSLAKDFNPRQAQSLLSHTRFTD